MGLVEHTRHTLFFGDVVLALRSYRPIVPCFGGVYCALPGKSQSVPAAELFALWLILHMANGSADLVVVTDSLYVSSAWQRFLSRQEVLPAATHSHMWNDILRMVNLRRGSLSVRLGLNACR